MASWPRYTEVKVIELCSAAFASSCVYFLSCPGISPGLFCVSIHASGIGVRKALEGARRSMMKTLTRGPSHAALQQACRACRACGEPLHGPRRRSRSASAVVGAEPGSGAVGPVQAAGLAGEPASFDRQVGAEGDRSVKACWGQRPASRTLAGGHSGFTATQEWLAAGQAEPEPGKC